MIDPPVPSLETENERQWKLLDQIRTVAFDDDWDLAAHQLEEIRKLLNGALNEVNSCNRESRWSPPRAGRKAGMAHKWRDQGRNAGHYWRTDRAPEINGGKNE